MHDMGRNKNLKKHQKYPNKTMKKEPALLQLSSKSNRSFLGFEYNLRQNYNRYFIFTGDT